MTGQEQKIRHGGRGKWIADLCLIAFLALVGGILFFFFRPSSAGGSAVRVRVGNEIVAEIPLSEEGRYSFADGGNVLVIRDGAAYMEAADCPDKICVKTGKISREGERIVCLPHRLMAEIISLPKTGEGG